MPSETCGNIHRDRSPSESSTESTLTEFLEKHNHIIVASQNAASTHLPRRPSYQPPHSPCWSCTATAGPPDPERKRCRKPSPLPRPPPDPKKVARDARIAQMFSEALASTDPSTGAMDSRPRTPLGQEISSPPDRPVICKTTAPAPEAIMQAPPAFSFGTSNPPPPSSEPSCLPCHSPKRSLSPMNAVNTSSCARKPTSELSLLEQSTHSTPAAKPALKLSSKMISLESSTEGTLTPGTSSSSSSAPQNWADFEPLPPIAPMSPIALLSPFSSAHPTPDSSTASSPLAFDFNHLSNLDPEPFDIFSTNRTTSTLQRRPKFLRGRPRLTSVPSHKPTLVHRDSDDSSDLQSILTERAPCDMRYSAPELLPSWTAVIEDARQRDEEGEKEEEEEEQIETGRPAKVAKYEAASEERGCEMVEEQKQRESSTQQFEREKGSQRQRPAKAAKVYGKQNAEAADDEEYDWVAPWTEEGKEEGTSDAQREEVELHAGYRKEIGDEAVGGERYLLWLADRARDAEARGITDGGDKGKKPAVVERHVQWKGSLPSHSPRCERSRDTAIVGDDDRLGGAVSLSDSRSSTVENMASDSKAKRISAVKANQMCLNRWTKL